MKEVFRNIVLSVLTPLLPKKELRKSVCLKIYSGWGKMQWGKMEKMLHLNERSAKSAGRLLQIHARSGDSCSRLNSFWKSTLLPLPVFNEGGCKKVAEKQSNSEKKVEGKYFFALLYCCQLSIEAKAVCCFGIKQTGCHTGRYTSLQASAPHQCAFVLTS